ncbi:zinc finger lsd1 subclass family protein, putative [Ichthyophthirius multifiliis]|uniref:Zinc finger lsd1 subclass family protein, putative n=1 Tax=Ichthyophthirius multifiliis TaxID=5932 RepID=G0QT39_ICHMU|nr:zinc finger lsd1 subclass family protein, putative [Ichthyophthirius multifiliis]EGR31614.1 zinc finger lsd1 subclass family protein, putative [Ichthyophthirius multifiliis]|eukprot:XP_004035100.1 zinc finger lsd1 subclass family protein, putative [Ichthyophthirius multifiliis]
MFRNSQQLYRPCSSPCFECITNDTKCTKCTGSYFLNDFQCVTSNLCPSGKYAEIKTNKCEFCDTKICKTCTETPKKCTSCPIGAFLQDNTCKSNCSKGTYGNSTSGICEPCNSKCKSCVGPSISDCSSCSPGSGYFNPITKICSFTCPVGYYQNNTYPDDLQCSKCQIGCDQCDNLSTCTLCNSSYFFLNGNCLTSCPSSYSKNIVNKICVKCNDTCFQCEDNEINNCTECQGDKFLQDKQCKYTCNGKFYPNKTNNICSQCHNFCEQCNGPTSLECTKCSGDLFLEVGQFTNTCDSCDQTCTTCSLGNQPYQCDTCSGILYLNLDNTCQQTCPSQYFKNSSNFKCQKCNDTCKECNGSLYTQCTECTGFLNLDVNKCVQNCPFGQFALNNKCELCDSNCKQCLNSKTLCTECNSPLYLDFTVNKCRSKCPLGTYSNSLNQKCESCNTKCYGCSGPLANECNQCTGILFLDIKTKTCVENCPDTFFGDKTTQMCQQCGPNCTSCDPLNINQCLSCKGDLFLYEGKCIKNCPEQYFENISLNNNICDSCDPTCLSCFGKENNKCISCNGDYYFYKNYCLRDCPEGTYQKDQINNNICDNCNSKCTECIGPLETECTKCSESLFLDQTQCISSCPERKYKKNGPGNINNICDDCHNTCYLCNGPSDNECTKCSGSKYFKANKCLTDCGNHQYGNPITQNCENCSSNCLQCFQKADDCTACDISLYLNYTIPQSQKYILTGKCFSTCPSQQFGNQVTNKCEKCDTNLCKECSKSSTKCTQCSQPTFLFDEKCILNCPKGTYPDQITNICSQCHISCKSCHGKESTDCNSCTIGKYYDEISKQCVENCPLLYYKDDSQQICGKCEIHCLKCEHNNPVICNNCIDNYYLFNGKCRDSCQAETYKNGAECLPCNSSVCKTCIDTPTKCTSCQNDKYLQQNECKENCNDLFYKGQKNGIKMCIPCQEPCLQCENEFKCLSCIQGLFFSNFSCLKNCPLGQFQDTKSKFLLCQDCDISCTSCSGPSNSECLSCSGSLYFDSLKKQCVNQCDSGYFSNLIFNLCEKCNSVCLECQGTSIQCTKCPMDLQLVGSQCIPCAKGFFYNKIAQDCQKCQNPCLECKKQEDICLKCIPGTYLYNNMITQTIQCLQECPLNTYLLNNSQCVACNVNCISCKGPSDQDCLICAFELVFDPLQNQCSTQCQQGYFIDDIYFPSQSNIQFKKCEMCHPTCLSCTGSLPNQCLECYPNAIKHQGQCLEEQPDGLFIKENKFLPCH